MCPPLAVCSLRQLLPDNRHFDILSIKEVFGGHQWNFWRVSWSNVFSFRLERQWLSSSKRKDPNITALKSKSGICTSLSSPLPCTSSKSCAHSGKYFNISYFRFTQITILNTVKTQTILSHHLKGRVALGFLRKTALDCYSSFILGHGN